MEKLFTIALIGDYSEDVIAHKAIPLAIKIAARTCAASVNYEWIDTDRLTGDLTPLLTRFAGVWCVPASPYKNMQGALNAIRYVREKNIPFLGTCGGYQHAALEYAHNVRGNINAENGEVNPQAEIALIAPLQCAIREEGGEIHLFQNTRIANIYARTTIVETYNCGYGINPQYLDLLVDEDLKISSEDGDHDPRSLEITSHRFFIATAFQPERSALNDNGHPLIQAFMDSVCSK